MQSTARNPASEPLACIQTQPTARGGLPGLMETLASIHSNGDVGVLGLVFATAGSTYQKPGATVLLDRSGMRHGAISGGCLEPQLEDLARAVCSTRIANTIDFDTRSDEDLIFGSGTGCRGRIHLLLLPLSPDSPLAFALKRLTTAADALEVRIVTEGSQLGCGYATLGTERWHWDRSGHAIGRSIAEGAAVAGPTAILRIEPPPRVLLFGAGPETAALNLFTQRLGWRLTVVEHRGRWLKFAQAANVTHIIELPPDEAVPVWVQQRVDAAVAMTHNYALDKQHLTYCADSEISYVGLLGPAARRDAMLAELGGELAGRLRDRLHAPVGLGLGGSGPEPLALSVVAELQQHFVARRRSR